MCILHTHTHTHTHIYTLTHLTERHTRVWAGSRSLDTPVHLHTRRCGRKRAVWFSVSRDLKMDAARDLADLGHDTKSLNLYPEGDSSLPNAREPLEAHGVKDGVLFMTYSLLINSAGKGGRNCAARQVDEVGTLTLTLTLTLPQPYPNPNQP